MTAAARLRTLAQEAITIYKTELIAGGEPVYPRWADDVLNLLDDYKSMASTIEQIRQMSAAASNVVAAEWRLPRMGGS